MTTFQLFRRTYVFVLIRFVITVLTVIPIYPITLFYVRFLFKLFNIQVIVGSFQYYVFVATFGTVGWITAAVVLNYFRNLILVYSKAAHVIAITKLCIEDEREENESLVLESFREVFRSFIKVNIFMLAGGLIHRSIDDISKYIISNKLLPFKENKQWFMKLFGSTIKTVVDLANEITLSYVYFRERIDEEYDTEESTSRKKKDNKKTLVYAGEGICFYIKACLPMMKSSFITVLGAYIFQWVSTFLIVTAVLFSSGYGIKVSLYTFILLYVFYTILKYTFLEPYQICAMLSEFYKTLEKEEVDISKVKLFLASMSKPFNKLLRQSGERIDKDITNVEDPFGQNLEALARGRLVETFMEDDLDAGTDDGVSRGEAGEDQG